MMGCNSSMDTNSVLDESTGVMAGMTMSSSQWPLSQANPTDVVLQFVRLDDKISKLEATCPGPRLATCEAWIEHLQDKQGELRGVDAKQISERLHSSELTNKALSSSTSAFSQQQPSLPSQVIDNGVLHIDGYTAEHPLSYNNNKAVAFGKVGGADNVNTIMNNDMHNGLLPFTSNPTHMNGIVVGGYGTTRLLPSNDFVTKTPTQDLVNNPTDVVLQFVRLDDKISKLEATCPGPRLATCEAWIEHLQDKQGELRGVDAKQISERLHSSELTNKALSSSTSAFSQQQPSLPSQVIDNGVLHIDGYTAEHPLSYNNNKAVAFGKVGGADNVNTIMNNDMHNGLLPFTSNPTHMNGIVVGGYGTTRLLPSNDFVTKTPTQDLVNLALNLGVIGDVQKASTHEDLFAQLSESALHLMTIRCYTEILEHTKVRLKTLLDSYAELNELYVNHDGKIAFISGGTYMSSLEEALDSQLEKARDVRDKLGSTLEQWRICGLLLRASSNSATQSLKQWRKVKSIVNPKEKLETALSCRKDLQSSLVSLECAQFSLPHVEIKHISNRQILAVKHCNTYMVTDVANAARYEHTSKVFVSYESSISKASSWLYETFNKTLRNDFDRAEETVRNLAKTLRGHREEIFISARR